jgi:hypothetical protein
MPREDLAVTTADEQRGWRLALAEMVERGLQKLARGEGIGGLHIDDLLPLEQVRAMGRDSIFGTLLIAWDSFADAVDHNFPDMGNGISVREGENVFRDLLDGLKTRNAQVPERFAVFSRHLPFRP